MLCKKRDLQAYYMYWAWAPGSHGVFVHVSPRHEHCYSIQGSDEPQTCSSLPHTIYTCAEVLEAYVAHNGFGVQLAPICISSSFGYQIYSHIKKKASSSSAPKYRHAKEDSEERIEETNKLWYSIIRTVDGQGRRRWRKKLHSRRCSHANGGSAY